ncbi:MAG: hypothetical protein KGH82_03320 [Candidatus Micrarchaeota archaeon]|nr:hypothetical protein [Candidatus Micrarchaeota archaeon]
MLVYHTYLTVIVPALIAFIITTIATRFLMDYFLGAGVVGDDNNKPKKIILPSSGGIAVSFGLIIGMMAYTFGGTFVYHPTISVSELLAAALSIILIAFVGFLDDINVSSRKVVTTDMKSVRKGLKQWQKPLLTVIGAIPLMAINAGISTVTLPLVGPVSFGLVYPIIILPLAVIFVSNSFNLLGGFDGLQSGMGLVASFGLLLYTTFFGSPIGALISALLFASLLAFIPFNIYKARIIPGDSFTYCVGGALVAIITTGNAEAFGLIIFIPWIIEFVLHARRKFKVTDLGILQKDGTMKPPYGKSIYSLTHVVMNMKKLKEYEVSAYLVTLEALFVLFAFGLKFAGLL